MPPLFADYADQRARVNLAAIELKRDTNRNQPETAIATASPWIRCCSSIPAGAGAETYLP